ncbi:3-dehydroquinate synthase [Terricaulis sp.]|uniref:3-dehydroquinate synthase n=1 Tax=Terricaulis sp. TaxID=2768686 RepID=UPI003784A736
MTEVVHASLGARAYDVHIGADLIARAGALIAPFAPKRRVFVVTDQNVARLHRPALIASLDAAGLKNWTVTLPVGEAQKSFQGLELLTRHLLQAGIERSDLVIAFGGGVIGDLAGLGAGLLKRGIDFVQIPTTLLAQVDSSVGGKTAIDTPEGKNLIGLFHQPKLVLADLNVLTTLPEREVRAGYAEIVKIGLIADPQFFTWCETNASALLAGDEAARAHAIRHAVAAKAAVVAADETEQGDRALLNLGHTFAHALEASAGYDGALLHGEAVAVGMKLAFEVSAELGLAPAADYARVAKHLAAAGFITDLRKLPGAPYDPDQLMAIMARDKKAQDGKLALVLARGIGRAYLDRDAPADVVRELLQQETK